MDEEFIKKFKRESLAAASLSHPNIVSVYDVGEQDGIYFIVMEYIQGQTLKEYIRKNIKMNYNEALNIVYQICLALEHAHKNGIVHRDIKPHNILITDDKIIKVTDFGIARASSSVTMTNTNNVMGSVHYFSPEQARGGYSDHRTDIYSLGVVMYEMLTGSLPYDAESPITVALKHIQDSVKEPVVTDPSIPKAVNDIVVKAMEKDMTKRYQNARELINDIQKAQNNPNVSLYDHKIDDQSTRVIPIEEINKASEKSAGNKKRGKKAAAFFIGLLAFAIISVALVKGFNE
jgi:serine/threonine-protein kinase